MKKVLTLTVFSLLVFTSCATSSLSTGIDKKTPQSGEVRDIKKFNQDYVDRLMFRSDR